MKTLPGFASSRPPGHLSAGHQAGVRGHGHPAERRCYGRRSFHLSRARDGNTSGVHVDIEASPRVSACRGAPPVRWSAGTSILIVSAVVAFRCTVPLTDAATDDHWLPSTSPTYPHTKQAAGGASLDLERGGRQLLGSFRTWPGLRSIAGGGIAVRQVLFGALVRSGAGRA